jgi:cystathionine beta-synthase
MSILDQIGNTPIVEVRGFDTGCCKLFAKLECQNPGGSIKDRIAVFMIADAEARGVLKPGGTIVEATAGNTGLALALVAAQKGYRLVLVIPDKMSREKINHLRAMGAEVFLTRSDVAKGHPDYYQDRAKVIAEQIPGAWFVDQFTNPANPEAHKLSTAPEIWEQMEHDVDAIVLGVGSGGTLGGLTKYFSGVQPKLDLVLADPLGSIMAPYVRTGRIPDEVGSWLVEGIGEDFLPVSADLSMVRAAYSVSDEESFDAARTLLRTNSIFGGSSSGTLLVAALRYCREQKTPKRVLTFACDGGNKYLSKMYSDFWMADQGYLARPSFGDLRDLVARPFSEGSVVTVKPDETLKTAHSRMKMYELSQVPFMDGEQLIGIVDEDVLLRALLDDADAMKKPVKELMSVQVRSIDAQASLTKVAELLNAGGVAMIQHEGKFFGLVTKMDVVDHVRRSKVKLTK